MSPKQAFPEDGSSSDYSTVSQPTPDQLVDSLAQGRTQQARYVLATFVRYATDMTQPTPGFTNAALNLAFVIRMTWDQAAGQWRILLKPVNGQEARLFRDVETVLVYLETVMQQEQTKGKI